MIMHAPSSAGVGEGSTLPAAAFAVPGTPRATTSAALALALLLRVRANAHAQENKRTRPWRTTNQPNEAP